MPTRWLFSLLILCAPVAAGAAAASPAHVVTAAGQFANIVMEEQAAERLGEYRVHRLQLVQGSRAADQQVTMLELQGQWLIRDKDMLATGLRTQVLASVDVEGEVYRLLPPLSVLRWHADLTWSLLFVPPEAAADTGAAPQEAWLEVAVNRSTEKQLVIALLAGGDRILLPLSTLQGMRLQSNRGAVFEHFGEAYAAIESVPGLRAVLNEREQSLMLYASAQSFFGSESQVARDRWIHADFSPRGGVFNYSLFANADEQQERASGQFELAGYAGRSFVNSTFLATDIGGARHNSVRLDSAWRLDWPQRVRTLTVGDTISRAGSWGNALRYGGLQWATDFSTQPGIVIFPTPAVSGEAIVPSTVDIFVNNARRATQEIEPGPFTVRNVPVVTGSGDMRLVIRDLFGREQVIHQPFYSSRGLLREGLREYAVELGTLRENYTLNSDDYGHGFATGMYRYGISDRLTAEVRGEAMQDQAAVGGALDWLWTRVGEFSVVTAASQTDAGGEGYHGQLAFQRQSRRLSFGATVRGETREFRRVGGAGQLPDAMQLRGFASLPTAGGSVSTSYTRINARNKPPAEFVTLQYSRSVGRSLHFRVGLIESLGDTGGRIITLSLAIPLGQSSAQLGATHQEDGGSASVQLQRNQPSGPGWGYRLLAETGEVERYEADSRWRTDTAEFSAQAAQLGGSTEYRAGAEGGVALVGGDLYLARRLDKAFAVVSVPNLGGVDIYRDNRRIAETGDDGKAIVPGLRAYQSNHLRLGDASMPLDIEVASLQREAVPAYRRGLRMHFDIRRSHWVSFTLLREDGEPVAAGVELVDEESGERFAMGLEGQVYLQARSGAHSYRLDLKDGSCRVSIAVPEGDVLFPDLGEQTCRATGGTP